MAVLTVAYLACLQQVHIELDSITKQAIDLFCRHAGPRVLHSHCEETTLCNRQAFSIVKAEIILFG